MKSDAIELVSAFLGLLTTRDITAAANLLADGAVMVFPGGEPFATLDALTDWSKSRYLDIEKNIEGFDAVANPDSTTTVYCYGTLQGHWTNGDEFSGIRFIDRFVIADGKILCQDVWNDLAENLA